LEVYGIHWNSVGLGRQGHESIIIIIIVVFIDGEDYQDAAKYLGYAFRIPVSFWLWLVYNL